MSVKEKLFNSGIKLLKTGTQVFGKHNSNVILGRLSEELAPIIIQPTDFGAIKFFCPGNLPQFRADTLLTKEPETIKWINTFKEEEVFWDIGANMGVYTLYAAIKKLRILAFEPSPANYYLLSKNIEINQVDDMISSFCIAFSDETKLDDFHMSNTELGAALNSFGEAIDWQGKPYHPSFKQATIGFSIDEFIEKFNPPFPNHLKIDVDGIEAKIIKGAQKTLFDTRLKSLLVELDSSRKDYCDRVINFIEKNGMSLKEGPIINNKDFGPAYNYIFVR
jgi:FkbM family methyltransferase